MAHTLPLFFCHFSREFFAKHFGVFRGWKKLEFFAVYLRIMGRRSRPLRTLRCLSYSDGVDGFEYIAPMCRTVKILNGDVRIGDRIGAEVFFEQLSRFVDLTV